MPHPLIRRSIKYGATVIVLLGIASSAHALLRYTDDRTIGNLSLGATDISYKTQGDIRAVIEQYRETVKKDGVRVHFQDEALTLYPDIISFDPDISPDPLKSLIAIDTEETLNRAFSYGHSGTASQIIGERLNGVRMKTSLIPAFKIDEKGFAATLSQSFLRSEELVREPSFEYDSSHTLVVRPGSSGKRIDSAAALQELSEDLASFSALEITLELAAYPPSIDDEEAKGALEEARKLLSHLPLKIVAGTYKTTLSDNEVLDWLFLSRSADGSLHVKLDEESVHLYMSGVIAPHVTIDALQPKFEIVKGMLRATQMPTNGKELDLLQSVQILQGAILTKTGTSVQLVVRDISHPLLTEHPDLQIEEVVAQAETDFKGSPPNRRKNIAVGMARINGLLVPPGEEFSLVAQLAPIDATNGFLSELVIKGNKTTPEFGGGLCQVSTTLFRAVSAAGLPILERRNHSYRVSYYEPPVGYDATIYFPKPDFRFKNDTGSHILIQARVSGTKAHITLWGKKDGRTVAVDPPKVTNIQQPQKTIVVETDSLKPGQKKCTERAHSGADAVFERRVTYPTGETLRDIFKSHYVVWPAVCLVGKQPVPESFPTEGALMSSTPDSIP